MYSRTDANPETQMLGGDARFCVDFQGNVVVGREKYRPGEAADLVDRFMRRQHIGSELGLAHCMVLAIAERKLEKVEAILVGDHYKFEDIVDAARAYANSGEAKTLNKILASA